MSIWDDATRLDRVVCSVVALPSAPTHLSAIKSAAKISIKVLLYRLCPWMWYWEDFQRVVSEKGVRMDSLIRQHLHCWLDCDCGDWWGDMKSPTLLKQLTNTLTSETAFQCADKFICLSYSWPDHSYLVFITTARGGHSIDLILAKRVLEVLLRQTNKSHSAMEISKHTLSHESLSISRNELKWPLIGNGIARLHPPPGGHIIPMRINCH